MTYIVRPIGDTNELHSVNLAMDEINIILDVEYLFYLLLVIS